MAGRLAAFPVNGDQTVLPACTELNEDALTNPREVFRSEALHGRKSAKFLAGQSAFASICFHCSRRPGG
jgi:hypothetical protein